MKIKGLCALTLATLVLPRCMPHVSPPDVSSSANLRAMNEVAQSYVRLVLAVGEHDADFVDAYYGPPQWRDEIKKNRPALGAIRADAERVVSTLRALAPSSGDEMSKLRHAYLTRQTEALLGRVAMLSGTRLTFDEESKVLYDAVAPKNEAPYFEGLLTDLDRELPGEGAVSDRLEAFRSRFAIPRDKLDAVFNAAIEGCRSRTVAHIALPTTESFTVEYVTNKSWSGYNWYQGKYRSLIQVNTDLPIFVDRAVDLACHEGYPGHHVYNVLLEKHLVNDRGWIEFTVYPLFSPQSLIAEGTANFGIDVAFPQDERTEFEKRVLFPIAGFDQSKAERYYRIHELTQKLAYAGNEAARGYLNGELSAEQAAGWLVKYSLMSPERATQRVRFMDQYRSYVINYNLGKDLVKAHVEALGGTPDNPQKRWQIFNELIASPRLPSGLARR